MLIGASTSEPGAEFVRVSWVGPIVWLAVISEHRIPTLTLEPIVIPAVGSSRTSRLTNDSRPIVRDPVPTNTPGAIRDGSISNPANCSRRHRARSGTNALANQPLT